MNSRRLGEALLWLGIVVMLSTAAADRITGNVFAGLFTAGIAMAVAGLSLMLDIWRPR